MEEDRIRLYHLVPEDVRGDTLHPLGELRVRFPDVYERAWRKYADREHVPSQPVPILGCRWMDVLHLTPVHPVELKEALEPLGLEYPRRFYEVDPLLLDPDRTVIFAQPIDDPRSNRFSPAHWHRYDGELVRRHRELPQATKAYYRAQVAAGRRPLLFPGVAHVLYRGSLDSRRLPVLELD